MKIATIEQIIPELRTALVGHRFGKIFPLSRHSMAIDFRLSDSLYLFISVESSDPRIYFIRRRLRDLEKASTNSTAFVMQLKKRLAGADVIKVEQLPNERAVEITLSGRNDLGADFSAGLIAQLTGKSANLFLLDSHRQIVDSIRETLGDGQQVGDIYSPPSRPASFRQQTPTPEPQPNATDSTISELLDAVDLEKRSEAEFSSAANSARSKITREIAKFEKLRSKLRADLGSHGDADRWKKFGDLILANVATAKRSGSLVSVIDYFDEATPTIEIEVEENDALTTAAEKFFKRYTKARNARDEIARRIDSIERDLDSANAHLELIEKAIEERDLDTLLEGVVTEQRPGTKRAREQVSATSAAARIFISSDGFELLVGKRAKDNDHLTFKIAKSLDTWMHAADYPGSHVVIRNSNRKEIPPTTLLEAAQLAAFYSQGKAQPKAAVHYTLKKFVNKPKGAAPGLVSLASFKTLLVVPEFHETVLKKE